MNTTSARPSPPSWLRSLAQRLKTLWLVKAVGTTLGVSGFFVLYFWVMHTRSDQAVVVPLVALDDWIAVSELALLPYASLWLYVSLAPALAANMAALRAYVGGALLIAAAGLAIYWIFPTTTPPFGLDWATYPALQFLKAADAGGNAFPSLHVAFAAYTAVVIERELRSLQAPSWLRALNSAWCVAIVYSTLATRQHVLVDVLGGLVLAWAAWQICRSPGMERLVRGTFST